MLVINSDEINQSVIEDVKQQFNASINSIPKKRGRKPKNIVETAVETNIKIPKKRGRKPKGGKVVACLPNGENAIETKINVILHLKCNKLDITGSYDIHLI